MTAARPILELKSVSKHFGGLSVVEDLSFSVRGGTRTALIGPTATPEVVVWLAMGEMVGAAFRRKPSKRMMSAPVSPKPVVASTGPNTREAPSLLSFDASSKKVGPDEPVRV